MEAGRAQEARWAEESDIMAQLLAPFPYSNEQGQKDACFGISSMLWPSDHAAESCYSESENVYSSSKSFCYWSQGSDSSASNLYCNSSGYESCYLSESNAGPAVNPAGFCFMQDQLMSPALRVIPNPSLGDQTAANEEASSGDVGFSSLNLLEQSAPPHVAVSLAKRKSSASEDDSPASRKKAKAPATVPKNGRKTQSKRTHKASKSCEEDELNAAKNDQSPCSCFSEDDDSQTEQNGSGNTISSSKTRAGRGSATDPQSLYARKRRERINERLKTLQNLVPNGTKVDISTMLEEAVQYVKFLQLQIKLLSSDDLWMYAPIAYNGMNIGLDLKISPPPQ